VLVACALGDGVGLTTVLVHAGVDEADDVGTDGGEQYSGHGEGFGLGPIAEFLN
jgi:hypothetical protein